MIMAWIYIAMFKKLKALHIETIHTTFTLVVVDHVIFRDYIS